MTITGINNRQNEVENDGVIAVVVNGSSSVNDSSDSHSSYVAPLYVPIGMQSPCRRRGVAAALPTGGSGGLRWLHCHT